MVHKIAFFIELMRNEKKPKHIRGMRKAKSGGIGRQVCDCHLNKNEKNQHQLE